MHLWFPFPVLFADISSRGHLGFAVFARALADGPVEGLFGPAVEVGDDAPALDRAIALSGRDPAWSA